MRVQVLTDESIGPQARAYAEYRVFAALTHMGGLARVRHACVVLRSGSGKGCDRVACAVAVGLDTGDPIRIHGWGPHPYAAVGHAVEQLRLATTEAVHLRPIESTALR